MLTGVSFFLHAELTEVNVCSKKETYCVVGWWYLLTKVTGDVDRVVRAGVSSHQHEMNCHDLEAMISNHGRVELGVRSPSFLSRT